MVGQHDSHAAQAEDGVDGTLTKREAEVIGMGLGSSMPKGSDSNAVEPF